MPDNFETFISGLEEHAKDLVDLGYKRSFVMAIGLLEMIRNYKGKEPLHLPEGGIETLQKTIKMGVRDIIYKAISPICVREGLEGSDIEVMSEHYTNSIFEEIARIKKVRNLGGNN